MAEEARWTLKEGYILALAPAIGLFCINRYEAGRFSYLDIPSELIDLPVTRLISGGTAIAVLAVVLAYFLRWSGAFLRVKSGWREFVGTFLLFFAAPGNSAATASNNTQCTHMGISHSARFRNGWSQWKLGVFKDATDVR